MCTYVFHFGTAQIHQGSCTALGDFLLKEEPHYAIEEVLSKNTCRDLLLSASPQGQLGRLRSTPAAAWSMRPSMPSLPVGQAVKLSRLYLHLPGLGRVPKGNSWHLLEPLRALYRLVRQGDSGRREVQGQVGGVPYPKGHLTSGLDCNVVL